MAAVRIPKFRLPNTPFDSPVLTPKNPIDVRTAPSTWGPKPILAAKAAAPKLPAQVLATAPKPFASLARFPDQGIRESFVATAHALRGLPTGAFEKVGVALSELAPQLRFSLLGEAAHLDAPVTKVTMALFDLEDSLISSAKKPSLTPAERAQFVDAADRITDLHEHLMIATDTRLPVRGVAGERLRALTEGPTEIMAKQMRLIENARSFFDDLSSGLWPTLSKAVNSAVKIFAREVPSAGLPEFEKALLTVEDQLLGKLKNSNGDETVHFQMVIAANSINDMYRAASVLAAKEERSPGAPSTRLFKELQRLARASKPGDEQ